MRSKSLTFLVLEVVEVFQGFVQDQVRYSVLWSTALTFQFLVVVIVKVFNVFLPDVVPDSVLWSRTSTFLVPIAHGVLWSRTSTFQFLALALLVVFKVFLPTEFPTACCGAEHRLSRSWPSSQSWFSPKTGFATHSEADH